MRGPGRCAPRFDVTLLATDEAQQRCEAREEVVRLRQVLRLRKLGPRGAADAAARFEPVRGGAV